MSTSQFSCKACNRSVLEITSGFHMILFAPKDSSDEMFDWVNDILTPFWRAEKEKLKDKNEAYKEPTPVPPRLPRQVTGFFVRDDKYVEVDHQESYKVEIPPDPIRVKHDEFWGGVLKVLGIEAVETRNRYFPDNGNFENAKELEPWYTCEVNGATLLFGPRKRVYSIQVEREEPFDVAAISKLAEADGTSYWANGGWHNHEMPKAKNLDVHAWGRDKLIAYFGLILGGLNAP